MQISMSEWPAFKTYLVIDRKMSSSRVSLAALKSRFKKFVTWLGTKDFTRDNFNLFLSEMQTAHAAVSYCNKMVNLAKHLDKYFKLGEFGDYTYFRETRQEKEILTPVEIESLANVLLPYKKEPDLVNLRQKTLITFLGTTGCRIGEALNLKWADIGSEPPSVVFRETKNGESRHVPIGRSIYDLLYLLPQQSEYVFTSYRNGPLGHQEVNLDLKKRALAVGIKKQVYNHIFRHSYVTTMLELGVDVSDVARIVGHKDINSTMRYKNSLLGYYSGVVQLHPLLNGTLSIEQISLNLKSYLRKLVDTSKYELIVSEGGGSLKIEIKAS